MMAVEIAIARQLAYHRGARKGRRTALRSRSRHGQAPGRTYRLVVSRQCAADSRRQRFALEFEISRVLCDARILNIFEGAAEIQAQVIARRLLEPGVN
jgi:(2S)-methylsuccinyl-CoA dehydrogenase